MAEGDLMGLGPPWVQEGFPASFFGCLSFQQGLAGILFWIPSASSPVYTRSTCPQDARENHSLAPRQVFAAL